MFKINKHRFSDYIFSTTLNLDTDFDFFVYNCRFLHKILSRPYARPLGTLIWITT
jgi:hypothetical protein